MATDLQLDKAANNWVNPGHPTPARKAPPSEVGVWGWLRANLFSGIGNSILTVAIAVFLWWAIPGLIAWVLQATWAPVWDNRRLFAVGSYPAENMRQPMAVLMMISALLGVSAGRWGGILLNIGIGLGAILGALALLPLETEVRIVLGLCVAFIVGGYLLGLRLPIPGSLLTWLWLLSLPVALIILQGGINLFGFEWSFAPLVDTTRYGGLMLTLLLAVVGIAFSFPIGVLLALGRRSELPAIKYFSISYIEIIRGVPLITLLFMGSNMLPLFLPQNAETPSAIVRAVVVITLFSAAYLAENVRGGLQAIPHGQYEAADALGLNGLDKLRHIILPQALTKVIPAIVGQFIGLYKDTSLVTLVGLLELMGVAKSVTQQPEWIKISGGVTKEVFLFVALVYFIFSFGMSYSSRRLESNLGAGRR